MGNGSGGRFVVGDPLRGLAALSVALYHVAFFTLPYTLTRANPGGVGKLFDNAYGGLGGPLTESLQLGLYIFFVLSGYLIAKPFIAWLTGLGDAPRVGRYALRRVLRIVPAFWAAIVATLVLHGLSGGDRWDLLAFVFFAQSYHPSELSAYVGQGWTLSVELAFYALLPLAAIVARPGLLRLSPRGRLITISAGIAACAVGSLVARARYTSLAESRAFPMMLFAFTPGMLLATLELGRGAAAAQVRRPGRVACTLLALAFAAAVVRQLDALRTPIGFAVTSSIACGCLVAAPLVMQWSGRRAWRVLDNEALHWLGERSYGLYVFHALAIFAIAPLAGGFSPLMGFVVVSAAAMPICLLAAHVSYHSIELPFLRLRHGGRQLPTPGGFAIMRRPGAIAALAAVAVVGFGALGLVDEGTVGNGPAGGQLQAAAPASAAAAAATPGASEEGASAPRQSSRRGRRRPEADGPAADAPRSGTARTPGAAAGAAAEDEAGALTGGDEDAAAESPSAGAAPASAADPGGVADADATALACARARAAAQRSPEEDLTRRERRRIRRACQPPETELPPAEVPETGPVPAVPAVPTVVPPGVG